MAVGELIKRLTEIDKRQREHRTTFLKPYLR